MCENEFIAAPCCLRRIAPGASRAESVAQYKRKAVRIRLVSGKHEGQTDFQSRLRHAPLSGLSGRG